MITLSLTLTSNNQIYAVGNNKSEIINIELFVNDAKKIIYENDTGKGFISEEIEKDTAVEDDSTEFAQRRSFAKNQDNEAEYSEKEEFSDTAFQTCRLIVKASETPDKLNSIGMASGFRDWYIIQFETEEDARSAYNYYLEKDEIVKVTPDAVYQRKYYIEPDEPNDEKNDPSDLNGSTGRLNSWGSICTGLYDVKDYIETNVLNPHEIVVGLIDSGINYNLEYFEGRIIRTYANYSGTGDENDEMDQEGHGTMVASLIVDNTPSNVKIAAYCNGSLTGMESESALAILDAVNDNVDILNCSFGNTNETGLLGDALDYAHEKDIPVVAAGGNFSENIHFNNSCWPAYDEKTISVGGFSNNGLPTIWTAFGKELDLLAPCENLPCVSTQGKTKTMSGTSFSAPMAVSLFTQMMTLYPELSNEEIEHRIKASADATDMFYECGLFGYGIIDAIGSAGLERNESPDFSLPEGKYIDEIAVEISAEPGCEIYYTLDSSYPSKENGILYTEPVRISDDCPYLKAVAYKEGAMRSEMAKSLYRLQRMGTDDMFTISGDGQIISYTGEVFDLIIPEKINGITVTGIASNTFSESNLSGVSFPDTLSEISEYAFENSDNLLLADGKNIKTIGHNAFESCNSLTLIGFPAVEIISNHAFVNCDSLSGISLPNCREIDAGGFQYCSSMRCAYLPKVTTLNGNVFQQDAMLTDIYLPSLKEFTNTALISGDFRECGFPEPLDLPKIEMTQKGTFTTLYLKRLEFSQVQVIRRLNLISLDETNYRDKSIDVILPSTLREIQGYSIGSNYRVYGTKGTYAEQWANENEFDFIEISQESAVMTDLPESFFDYMRYLEADVVGFNRTYQWYGSYADQNTGGVPIVGATKRRFVPKENEQYPYYYCVVTSTDMGYEPIEIRTGSSRYMGFNGEMSNANYSSLDEILATVPKDLSIYTDETVSALNEIISGIDRNLDASNQATVDGYVEAISNALSALKLKKHMVSFIVDNESVLSYEIEYGIEITDIPPNPDKTGYTFSKWTPDIPPAMPNNSLTFTAEFEPITYYASFMVDGEEIEKVPFTVESTSISEPDVPIKTGYTGKWSDYILSASDVIISAVYTPITYYATFTADGNQVGDKVPFTVESESISEPEIPGKEGYTGKWSEYIIAASDITVNAEYIINEYTVSFVADDKIIKSEIVEFGSKIKIPEKPQKEGYIFKEWLPKVPETMPAKDMTFYAVFEKIQDPIVTTSININKYVNVRTVDYKTTITFTALTDSMPTGATIVWYKDGQRAGTGEKFTVKEAKEAFTVQAKIFDKSGNTLDSTETELVKVKADFFSRIIAFFRMLFGKLPIIEQ